MIGQKFGMLTVKSRSDKVSVTGHIYWNCICDCGAEKAIRGSSLRTGHEKSCGCQKTEKIAATKTVRVDRSGVRFGKLVALRRETTSAGLGGYLCRCDCGKEVVVRTGLLVSGNTKSCGCGKNRKSRPEAA